MKLLNALLKAIVDAFMDNEQVTNLYGYYMSR